MDSFLREATKGSGADSSQSIMKQAEQIWSMLDDMAESNSESYKKFIEKTLKEGKEAMKQSSPEPHVCLKTKIIPSNKILYINILSWTKIPAPKSEDKPIPVYGRSIEDDVENSCSIVNVAFNPTVLNDSQLKKVAMELAFDYIEQQNNTKVNRNEYSILKESRYFGDLNQIQKFISVKKESPETLEASMIDSDLPENLIQKLTNLSTKKSASTTTNETNKHVVIEELKSTPPQTLKLPIYEEKVKDSFYTLKIHLPLVESFSECELNIDSVNKSILLDVQNTYKNLMIPFGHLEGSFIVDTSQIQAKFVRKDRILKVKIPLISNLSK